MGVVACAFRVSIALHTCQMGSMASAGQRHVSTQSHARLSWRITCLTDLGAVHVCHCNVHRRCGCSCAMITMIPRLPPRLHDSPQGTQQRSRSPSGAWGCSGQWWPSRHPADQGQGGKGYRSALLPSTLQSSFWTHIHMHACDRRSGAPAPSSQRADCSSRRRVWRKWTACHNQWRRRCRQAQWCRVSRWNSA